MYDLFLLFSWLQVINWHETLRVPQEAQLCEDSTDLILRLCTSSESRLGVNGAGEIKVHPFFTNVHFDTLRRFFDDGGHPLPVNKLSESKDSNNDPVYV